MAHDVETDSDLARPPDGKHPSARHAPINVLPSLCPRHLLPAAQLLRMGSAGVYLGDGPLLCVEMGTCVVPRSAELAAAPRM